MKDELKSIQDNDIWDLIELPEGVKPIRCKWIFKTKKDSKGNIERYKACLVAKSFTHKEDINYKEIFSLVSSKDSSRTIMTLVAHFDLELHQLDVKIAFLNDNIDEMIYMVQSKNFVSNESKSMVCKLKKFIYDLKQASRQWYHKFHQVITSRGFEENVVDDCVYHKFSGSKYIFMVLYVNDTLLASSYIDLLHETKRFLTKNFEMKDLGEASFVLGIQILRNKSHGILRLSQENYISKVLERFDMKDSKPGNTPIAKGDKFNPKQCPNNDLEINEMRKILYASIVGSLMYAQVYIRPDIAFVVGVWVEYILTYRKYEGLEIIRYFDSNFAGCHTKRSVSRYLYILVEEKFVKHTLIVPSSIVVEFVACFEAFNHRI
ncbi:hypothetical protein CR513_09476, partial [Mucuna pruriens]